MASNRRSRHITEGVQRAPNRSMFYGLGYEAEDFAKPMIGVANAQLFGTPTISDGMSMGTEGMKYSLAISPS